MVITVEISGVLEEKVRRLVDLGLYMSASEVIRDALRTLMKNINIEDIALSIYETRKATIDYISYLLEKPTPSVINMLAANEISPLLGDISDRSPLLDKKKIVIDKTTLYTIYSSRVVELLEKLKMLGYEFYIIDELVNPYIIYNSKFIKHSGKNISVIRIYDTGLKDMEYNRDIPYTSPLEQKIIEIAYKNGFAILSEDIRYREILKERDVRSSSIVWYIKMLYDNDIIKYDEFVNYIYMLKSVYVIIPPSIEGA